MHHVSSLSIFSVDALISMNGRILDISNSETLIAAIENLEQRSAKIKSVVYANPYHEIAQLREQVKTSIQKRGYTETTELIAVAAKRERELLSLIRIQKKQSPQLVLELLEIDMDIDELKRELSRLNFPSLIKV